MSQSLSQIKTLLSSHGLNPKKMFGQNFLHDGNQMRKIMEAARLQPGDRVLEVGPGTGALTCRMLEAGAEVFAAEIDRDMEAILTQHVAPIAPERFHLRMGDALDSKHAIAAELLELLGDQPYKLIANLPYNIASPLMANLGQDHPQMTDMVVLIQKEVADRLTAKEGTKAWGPLGIVLQAIFEIERVCIIPPGCFYPPPKVQSAVIALHRRPQPLCEDSKRFSKLMHDLFHQRRKQLGAIINRARLGDGSVPAAFDPKVRPEALSLQQLLTLDIALHNASH